MRTHKAAALSAATVFGVLLASSTALAGTTLATWVQYGPGNTSGTAVEPSFSNISLTAPNLVLVRAVVTDVTACPVASLSDGTTLPLTKRFRSGDLTGLPLSGTAKKTGGAYPTSFNGSSVAPLYTGANFGNGPAQSGWGECEAVVPVGNASTTVTVSGTTMKLPVAHPKRIVVMADTGCRMGGAITSNFKNEQNCSNPATFPFSYLAAYEASFNPDVVLQIGDWFYRDTNCVGSGTTSGGSEPFTGCNTNTATNAAYETWGDTFDSWMADVFVPAKPLLAAAPWVMVRGNHESCGRGARGWFAFLDPYAYNASLVACQAATVLTPPTGSTPNYVGDFEPSYIAALDGVDFIVHDSSFANDSGVDAGTAQNYDADMSNLLAAVGQSVEAVFATHKPTFGLSFNANATGCATNSAAPYTYNTGDDTEQSVFNGSSGYSASAFSKGVPANVAVFLSGHIHQFQYVNFKNSRFAPQLIVGTGGDLLDPDCGQTNSPPAPVPANNIYTAYPANVPGSTTPNTYGNAPTGTYNVNPYGPNPGSFTVNNNVASSVTSATAQSIYAHDEFGFAVLDAVTKEVNGVRKVVAYNAEIYKITSAKAGVCRITLSPRNISCSL